MTTVGTRLLTWAGGTHDFCIAASGRVLALEENRGCGVAEIYQRLREKRWYHNDVRMTIFHGLIGGGLAPERAEALVAANVDANPDGMAGCVILAVIILSAYLVGVPGDEVGKKKPEMDAAPDSSTTTDGFAAPPSSAPAPL